MAPSESRTAQKACSSQSLKSEDDEPSDSGSISSVFHKGATFDSLSPDLIIVSFNSMFFYVHSHIILHASRNNFNSRLPVPSLNGSMSCISVSEPANVLHIFLHIIYDLPYHDYLPSFNDLLYAVPALDKYGVPLEEFLRPSKLLFQQFMCYAPHRPMELYVFAASRNIRSLAVSTSTFLLSFPLDSISEDAALTMGPIYLKDLILLHHCRMEKFKKLVTQPPHPHLQNETCGFAEQKEMAQAWALAAANLVWIMKADLSSTIIETAMKSVKDNISCTQCRRAVEDRVHTVIMEWSVVKRTI